MLFSKSQKNLLVESIQEAGINPIDFQFEEKNELRITHRSTGFYFRIYTSEHVKVEANGQRRILLTTLSTPDYSGVIVQTTRERAHNAIDNWDTVINIFDDWLLWLKTEIDQPDLWAEMERATHMFDDVDTSSNDDFTQEEIKQLETRVAEVEERIISLGLPPQAEAAIIDTVREIPAKAKRLTKKEVADTLIGVFVKEGLKWGLTMEHVQLIWHSCLHFFTTITQIG